MSHRLRSVPFLLLFAACAHCDSSGNGDPASEAGALDAGADANTTERDAMTDDAGGQMDGSSSQGSADATVADAALPLPKRTYVYVGGYGSDPIRVFSINRTTFEMTPVITAPAGESPTYITPSSDGKHLYVANEANGKPGITVLRVDPATGIAGYEDKADGVSGHGFVFTALDPGDKHVLAASYNGADLGVYALDANGLITMRTDSHTFASGAQTHSVRVHPSGKWAYVPNKGLDSVAQFQFGLTPGKLAANGEYKRAGFDGPRHIAFSPDGKLAFVILELADELASFSIDMTSGALVAADSKPRLPAGFQGQDSGAHVLAHPHGKYVYGSNRGSNTIAAFSYDAQGKLTLIEHEPTRGETPRNFDIDPAGQFMVVANQMSGNMAVFAIEADGKLTPKGDLVTGLGQPAAVAILGF